MVSMSVVLFLLFLQDDFCCCFNQQNDCLTGYNFRLEKRRRTAGTTKRAIIKQWKTWRICCQTNLWYNLLLRRSHPLVHSHLHTLMHAGHAQPQILCPEAGAEDVWDKIIKMFKNNILWANFDWDFHISSTIYNIIKQLQESGRISVLISDPSDVYSSKNRQSSADININIFNILFTIVYGKHQFLKDILSFH